jgi:hypothetical protein
MSKEGPQRVELTRWERPLPAHSAYGRILAFSAHIGADRECLLRAETGPIDWALTLECAAFGWDRHREERSDAAIQKSVGGPTFRWIASLRSQ